LNGKYDCELFYLQWSSLKAFERFFLFSTQDVDFLRRRTIIVMLKVH
jgi:hypothetical protein